MISIGFGHFNFFSAVRFPSTSSLINSANVLAPYWNDHDLRGFNGGINYNVFSLERGDDEVINSISTLISNQRGMNFSGIWMLVADWNDAQSYPAISGSDRTNTYQATVITDGMLTFAVYTYSCDRLQWASVENGQIFSVIGFNINPANAPSASLPLFDNHPLSGLPTVNSVACMNQNMRVDTANLIYLVGNDSGAVQAARSECIKIASSDSTVFSLLSPSRLACPCSIFQAARDTRYGYISGILFQNTRDERFFNSACYVSRFRTFGREVQMCCYSVQ